ncbi:hypothetical protein FK531_21230 [Rhodococcus spelaei]|uniref:Uncharacterized protein n=1 Tax=Rhodococcus spelaei TaxID=2546320 RepID=A0A541AZW7_9NOCA|nr:hypothetical protein [Rhodococcus spelaei]TQF65620.1 hypothetical protein FK531_21230 [Rhodococcus spelaei]
MTTLSPPARKTLIACVFVASVVGAAFGVYGLNVEMAVVWLIVASVSGLYLLKLRAESRGRLERRSE